MNPRDDSLPLRTTFTQWLRGRLQSPSLTLDLMERLAGGYSNETWRIGYAYDRGGGREREDVILRIALEGGVSAPYDIPGQFALLQALEDTPIPAPRPHLLESDPEILGQPFYTMMPVSGATGPRFFEFDDPLRDDKLISFAHALADIHQLDWRRFGIGNVLAEPSRGTCADAALAWEKAVMTSVGCDDDPLAQKAVAWLTENKPADCEVKLIHGDPNLSNYRFENGAVVGVLDWEAAKLSDPAWDIAFYCGSIRKFHADQPEAIQERERAKFLEAYEMQAGPVSTKLLFWEVLFAFGATMRSRHPAMGQNGSAPYRKQLESLLQK